MKPHGRDCRDRCSSCLEAAGLLAVPVTRVSVEPGVMRDIPARDYYQRGARHSHNRTRTPK